MPYLKDVHRSTTKLLRTIGKDLVNSASMIKDLVVDLMQSVGFNPSSAKGTDLRSRINQEAAAAKLRRTEKARGRDELNQRLKFQRLLKKGGKKSQDAREAVRREKESFSRGSSVSHLAKMQQQSRAEKEAGRSSE